MSERREGRTPIYRCSEKGCSFSTDNLDAFIQHKIDERLPKAPPTVEPKLKKKQHKTAEEYLNCPECFPAFEKAFLERGYKKKEEKERGIL